MTEVRRQRIEDKRETEDRGQKAEGGGRMKDNA